MYLLGCRVIFVMLLLELCYVFVNMFSLNLFCYSVVILMCC